ncbi:unnamed protein product [Phytophthora lilii]|uniref:Unnamed protein product n=1 Tax=Phytophthora lilii TaxID=2077276 RepID=A0A9W6WGH9_9STRA|nr:unnamed protein product [Phytophthora lilii]
MSRHLIQHGALIDYQGEHGETALNTACELGQLDVVVVLDHEDHGNVNSRPLQLEERSSNAMKAEFSGDKKRSDGQNDMGKQSLAAVAMNEFLKRQQSERINYTLRNILAKQANVSKSAIQIFRQMPLHVSKFKAVL